MGLVSREKGGGGLVGEGCYNMEKGSDHMMCKLNKTLVIPKGFLACRSYPCFKDVVKSCWVPTPS